MVANVRDLELKDLLVSRFAYTAFDPQLTMFKKGVVLVAAGMPSLLSGLLVALVFSSFAAFLVGVCIPQFLLAQWLGRQEPTVSSKTQKAEKSTAPTNIDALKAQLEAAKAQLKKITSLVFGKESDYQDAEERIKKQLESHNCTTVPVYLEQVVERDAQLNVEKAVLEERLIPLNNKLKEVQSINEDLKREWEEMNSDKQLLEEKHQEALGMIAGLRSDLLELEKQNKALIKEYDSSFVSITSSFNQLIEDIGEKYNSAIQKEEYQSQLDVNKVLESFRLIMQKIRDFNDILSNSRPNSAATSSISQS